MSEISTVLSTANQQITNIDLSKIFILNNRYLKDQYVNNSSYNPITLKAGTVMARIHASGILVPLNTGGSDGSQFPVGILAHDLEVDASENVKATICTYGDVAQEKVIFFNANQGLETVVSSRRMKDHIRAQGINLVAGTEMTAYDNQ